MDEAHINIEEKTKFDNAIQEYSKFYENLSKTLTELSNKTQIKLMKSASSILVKI